MANEREESDPTETSPLLGERSGEIANGSPEVENGHRQALKGNPDATHTAAGDTSVVYEPSTAKLVTIVASMWVGAFFAALDTTIVATLTGPISSSFDSLSLLSWLGSGYLISNAACQPLSGKLTDIFSRRAGLIFSNVFFATGTLMCGLAPSQAVIIAGRVVAGIGGGGLTCISTYLMSDLVPLRSRGLWQGYGNLVFGLGMGLGGVFGGWMNDTLGWRWAFLVQVPFIVVSTILVWFLTKLPRKASHQSALSRIDFLGAFLLVLALVMLLTGLNTGGNQLPWSHPLVITSLVLSPVFLVGFIYVESNTKIAPEPIIPVRLLGSTRTVLFACLTNWFSTLCIYGVLYYVPLYLQVRGLSATQAGLRSIPFSITMSLASLTAGVVMRATGKYTLLNIFNMFSLILGSALLCALTLNSPSWMTYVFLIPLGGGYGGMLTVTLIAMISAVDHSQQAVITAASYAFRGTGSAIGITVAGAVFENTFTRELAQQYGSMPDSAKIINRLKDSLDSVKHLPKGWDRDVVLNCYMDAFRGSFATGLGLAVMAMLCAALMKQHVLHKKIDRGD